MNRRWGALLAALLSPVLASGAIAQTATYQPSTVVWLKEWRTYRNDLYCYTIKLPVDAELDTTDATRVRARLKRTALDPNSGRSVTRSWDVFITVTPNLNKVPLDRWLEEGSDTPAASTGLAEVMWIMKRRDVRVGGRNGMLKRIEGSGERRDALFASFAGYVYGLSYPVVDVDYQEILDEQMPTFRWVLDHYVIADPVECKPGASGR